MDRKVQVRLERQKRLGAPDAPALWVVLDEAVLRRQVGGPAVMAAQLAHIDQIAARPNVTRAGAAVHRRGAPGAARVVHPDAVPDAADTDVVYLEAVTGAPYLEKPQDVRRHSQMIDYLRAQALGPAESRALIAQLAQQSPD